jgi:hypothetical protein
MLVFVDDTAYGMVPSTRIVLRFRKPLKFNRIERMAMVSMSISSGA